MNWTKEDENNLLSFQDIVDYDGLRIKKQIKNALINNKYIIHVLANKSLEEADAEPDEYLGVNILDYYLIAPTQTKVQNFICFTINYDNIVRGNKAMKILNVNFVILCEHKNIKYGSVSRHDLLAALIQDQFNYTNDFGGVKLELVEDKESVVDTNYACRTLIFQSITDNNIVKTRNVGDNKVPIISNKFNLFVSEAINGRED